MRDIKTKSSMGKPKERQKNPAVKEAASILQKHLEQQRAVKEPPCCGREIGHPTESRPRNPTVPTVRGFRQKKPQPQEKSQCSMTSFERVHCSEPSAPPALTITQTPIDAAVPVPTTSAPRMPSARQKPSEARIRQAGSHSDTELSEKTEDLTEQSALVSGGPSTVLPQMQVPSKKTEPSVYKTPLVFPMRSAGSSKSLPSLPTVLSKTPKAVQTQQQRKWIQNAKILQNQRNLRRNATPEPSNVVLDLSSVPPGQTAGSFLSVAHQTQPKPPIHSTVEPLEKETDWDIPETQTPFISENIATTSNAVSAQVLPEILEEPPAEFTDVFHSEKPIHSIQRLPTRPISHVHLPRQPVPTKERRAFPKTQRFQYKDVSLPISYHPSEKQTTRHRMQKKFIQNAAQIQRYQQRNVQPFAKRTVEIVQRVGRSAVYSLGTLTASMVVLMVLFMVGLIAAILASPFGILFSNEPSPGAVPLNAAVSQINQDLTHRLERLQEGDYDSVDIQGEPPDWREVVAVFACQTTLGADGADVVVLTPDRVKRLEDVFWEMCVLTTEVETIDHSAGGVMESWTETILHITITPKTADEMREEYAFSGEQNCALTELLAELNRLDSLLEDLGVSQEDAVGLLKNLPLDLSPERKAVVRAACSLVGKVNYFWGGKSLTLGWDSRWGTLQQVTAAGSPTTGTYRPYGLDCSGFIDWVFYNATHGSYVIGHGGGAHAQHTYCSVIRWEDAQPGDLVFYPEDTHIGIVGGRDENGNLLVIHCASGKNNVVITGKSGFASIGRPYYYGE